MRLHDRLIPALLAISLATGAARAEPVAVVAALTGKVTIKPGRGWARAAAAGFGSPLESGDRINVGPRGSATLFFNDGNLVELGAGSSMTIGGRTAGSSPAGDGRLPREAFVRVRRFQLQGSRERGLIVAPAWRSGFWSLQSSKLALPEPLVPRQTSVLETRPTFRWQVVSGAVRYSITLSGLDRTLWTFDTDSTELAYPGDAAPLVAGEYVWDVLASGGERALGKASSTFHVMEPLAADTVRAVLGRMRAAAGGDRSAAARYMAGAYLFDRGLLADAEQEFSALRELAPAAAGPHEALGDVYRAMGLLDRAAASYARAREVSPAR